MKRLKTRKEAVQYLRERYGIPLSIPWFERLCSPAVGKGPKPAARAGKYHLYDDETLDTWGENYLQPAEEAA